MVKLELGIDEETYQILGRCVSKGNERITPLIWYHELSGEIMGCSHLPPESLEEDSFVRYAFFGVDEYGLIPEKRVEIDLSNDLNETTFEMVRDQIRRFRERQL